MRREWDSVDSILHNLSKSKYQRGAYQPGIAMDCRSMFLEVMHHCGNHIVSDDIEECAIEHVIAAQARGEYPYTENDAAIIVREIKTGKWQKIDQPEKGCAVVMALDTFRPNQVQHLGVCIDNIRFIHILEKHGCLISRTDDRFFKNKIRGYYRWIG